MIPLHFGQLHPYEMWLALALAFGPFIVLTIVVVIRRRQAIAEEEAGAAGSIEDQDPASDVIGSDPARGRNR